MLSVWGKHLRGIGGRSKWRGYNVMIPYIEVADRRYLSVRNLSVYLYILTAAYEN